MQLYRRGIFFICFWIFLGSFFNIWNQNAQVNRIKAEKKTKTLSSLFCCFGLKDIILSALCWRREDRLFLLPAVMLAYVTNLANMARTKCVCVCGCACHCIRAFSLLICLCTLLMKYLYVWMCTMIYWKCVCVSVCACTCIRSLSSLCKATKPQLPKAAIWTLNYFRIIRTGHSYGHTNAHKHTFSLQGQEDSPFLVH